MMFVLLFGVDCVAVPTGNELITEELFQPIIHHQINMLMLFRPMNVCM